MRTSRRFLAMIGGAATSAVLLAGCGTGMDDSAPPPSPEQEQQEPQDQQEQDKPMADGVTTPDDVFGPGCAQVPKDPNDEGSVQGMVDDPVGTAASNNPLLTKLTAAVKAAGLVDTLNDPNMHYTVFAPADPAFDAIPEDQLTAMLEDPAQKEKLSSLLTYHVVGERMDADGLAKAKTVESVQGGQLTVEGSKEDMTVNGAHVLCGNVPTANATVFVVDEVLMPPR